MLDNEPPICPTCGVTMVPAQLRTTRRDGGQEKRGGEWACLECEESGEADES